MGKELRPLILQSPVKCTRSMQGSDVCLITLKTNSIMYELVEIHKAGLLNNKLTMFGTSHGTILNSSFENGKNMPQQGRLPRQGSI